MFSILPKRAVQAHNRKIAKMDLYSTNSTCTVVLAETSNLSRSQKNHCKDY